MTDRPTITWPTLPKLNATAQPLTPAEEALQELNDIVAAAGGPPGTELPPPPRSTPKQPPIASTDGPATFADLLAFIAENKDEGTTVAHVTPDEYQQMLADLD